MSEEPRQAPRLLDAMPRPLLIAFIVFAVLAVAAASFVLLKPATFETVPVEARRPPPQGTFSHDVSGLIPAPTPSVVPTLPAPCGSVDGARLIGGGDAVLRLRAALELACRLEQGVSAEMTATVRALDGAAIRFAEFKRSGSESTLDYATGTIWLNLKFARRKLPIAHITPVLLHDASHLRHDAEPVTAAEELAARRIEVAACRELVQIDEWPRWCTDARALTDLDEPTALRLLRSADFA